MQPTSWVTSRGETVGAQSLHKSRLHTSAGISPSFNGLLPTSCKRVMPADFVILATKFVTLRSIFSLCVAKTSLNKLPTGPAPDDASATTNEKADVESGP